MILTALVSGPAALAVAPANDPFQTTWQRTDDPVWAGVSSRTWMWGPAAFAEAMEEPYLDSPGEEREVQYFDKSRMEITNPEAPRDLWYVTNGLLVVEMVSGRVQTGETTFEDREPAEVNVAGDAGDSGGPTYQTIGTLLDAEPFDANTRLTSRINRDGEVTDDPALTELGITAADLVPETNHRVASVFWQFMNATATIYQNGTYVEDKLFQNPFYATGFPITEAYWTTVLVGGTPADVLLQCFERRCLTYTPGNPPGWQVEAGNVGRHYYEWRHGPIATPTTGDIRIIDVLYDPADDGDRSGEYVTIKSFDPYPVDLTGWTLTDVGPRMTYEFPSIVLQPGSEIRVHNCTGTDTTTELFTSRCTAWWNNDGDTAYLHDAEGRLVSQFGY